MHIASRTVKQLECDVHNHAIDPEMRHASTVGNNRARIKIYVDKLLERLMKENELDRAQLAERLDISLPLVGNLINRSRSASVSVQNAISTAFGISLDAIKAFDATGGAELPTEPERQVSQPRTGDVRDFRLDSKIDEHGAVSGPGAWKYQDKGRSKTRPTGAGRREAKDAPPIEVRELYVPKGCDVLIVDSDKDVEFRRNDRTTEFLRGRELFIVRPGAEAENGKLVLAMHDQDPDDDDIVVGDPDSADGVFLMRFERQGELETLLPLDGNPKRRRIVGAGWKIVASVIERRSS